MPLWQWLLISWGGYLALGAFWTKLWKTCDAKSESMSHLALWPLGLVLAAMSALFNFQDRQALRRLR